jgi:hypothetical protein
MQKSLMILGLCAATALFAQGPRPGRGGFRGPGEMPGMGPEMTRTVTGAPYSAVEVRESTQTLPNGNVITRKAQSNIYRDSMGRVRTETTVQERGPRNAAAGTTAGAETQTARTIVTIHDPVAGVTRELNTQTKTAREIPLPNRGRGANTAAAGRPGRGGGAGTRGTTTNPNVKTETLSMQTINGVQATGTRVTRNIPAGQIGNAQAIQTVHETWMSPDLKVPVMVKTTDQTSRTTTTQLTNITRSEPDPALFQTPSDYTVTKGRGGRGGARASQGKGNGAVIN